MMKVYVELPDYYTDEACKYTKKLLDVICGGNAQLAEGKDYKFVVGVCSEENYELLQYLTNIDTVAMTDESDVSDICPEAIVVGNAM